jgi:hypothetical protein
MIWRVGWYDMASGMVAVGSGMASGMVWMVAVGSGMAGGWDGW